MAFSMKKSGQISWRRKTRVFFRPPKGSVLEGEIPLSQENPGW